MSLLKQLTKAVVERALQAEMPPLAFCPAMNVGARAFSFWISPNNAALEFNFDCHSIVFQRELNLLDRPRAAQPWETLTCYVVFTRVL